MATPLKDPEPHLISVFVAQAEEPSRIGLTSILHEAGKPFVVAGQAASGTETVQLVEKLKPNIALVSVCFPDMHGTDVAKNIKQRSPCTKLMMLTKDDCSIDNVLAAFEAGAGGYYLSDARAEELTAAVRAVSAGSCCIAPRIAQKILDLCKAKNNQNDAPVFHPENAFGLTKREFQVLELIVEGLSNQEIAERLRLRETTVKSHVCQILEKLSVSGRTAAAVKAVKSKIFDCCCRSS